MVKRAKAVDAKLVWEYETMLVPASNYDAIAADLKAASILLEGCNRRIAALEAALDWALDHTKGPETEPPHLSEILNASRERLLPGCTAETLGESG